MAILKRIVRIKNPIAYMPSVMRTSGKVGRYLKISFNGDGVNPGISRLSPLSIHMDKNLSLIHI